MKEAENAQKVVSPEDMKAYLNYKLGLTSLYGAFQKNGIVAIAELVDDMIESNPDLVRTGYIQYLINHMCREENYTRIKEHMLRSLVSITAHNAEPWMQCFSLSGYGAEPPVAVSLANFYMDLKPGRISPDSQNSLSSLGITGDELGFGIAQIVISFIVKEAEKDGLDTLGNEIFMAAKINDKFRRVLSYFIGDAMYHDVVGMDKEARGNEILRVLVMNPMVPPVEPAGSEQPEPARSSEDSETPASE